MFSALSQGSPIYILDRKNDFKLTIGEVVSKTDPIPTYGTYGADYTNTKININVKTETGTLELKQLRSSDSVANDPDSGTFITETREAMATEVRNMIEKSQKIIDSIPFNQTIIDKGGEMLKQLDHRYAKEQKIDEDISNLKTRQDKMDGKLDRILEVLTTKN